MLFLFQFDLYSFGFFIFFRNSFVKVLLIFNFIFQSKFMVCYFFFNLLLVIDFFSLSLKLFFFSISPSDKKICSCPLTYFLFLFLFSFFYCYFFSPFM
jgi:hypothetical protein